MIERFNPRAHAGRDRYVWRGILSARVSIHAPTRGATGLISQIYHGIIVSIHAPTRGATLFLPPLPYVIGRFNPRAHAGRDTMDSRAYLTGAVSIHAPTRGATEWDSFRATIPAVSIHAPTRGATKRQNLNN